MEIMMTSQRWLFYMVGDMNEAVTKADELAKQVA